jgi:hypothetical protein
MLLRHATPIRNLASIQRFGLLCSKSQGKKKVCWLHTVSKSSWAVLHTVRRHGGRVQDVVIIEVEVTQRALRRSKRGLRYSVKDIGPNQLRRIIGFAELSKSPVDERRLVAC